MGKMNAQVCNSIFNKRIIYETTLAARNKRIILQQRSIRVYVFFAIKLKSNCTIIIRTKPKNVNTFSIFAILSQYKTPQYSILSKHQHHEITWEKNHSKIDPIGKKETSERQVPWSLSERDITGGREMPAHLLVTQHSIK